MLYLIHLEQLDTRYTAQWRRWFNTEFLKNFEITNIDGPVLESVTDNKSFLNWSDTILFKNNQMQQIAELFRQGNIKEGDKFLFSDGWNPEVVSLRYLSVMNNIPIQIYALFHAGSWDRNDLVYKNGGKSYFKGFEQSLFDCIDKSFVATQYHKDLILKYFRSKVNSQKIIVTGFPYCFDELDKYKSIKKENLIIFPHRLSNEKQPKILKNLKDDLKELGYEINFCQEKTLTKDEYHTLLAKSKFCFSASLQETMGISVYEAMYLNSQPIVPNFLSYEEMYFEEFKYNHKWILSFNAYLQNKEIFLLYLKNRINDYTKLNILCGKNIFELKNSVCRISKIIEEISND